MSTLDLTADKHKQRRETVIEQLPVHHILASRNRFIASFDYLYSGLAVLCTESPPGTWSITTHPGTLDLSTGGDGISADQDINAADIVFYGNRTYEISDSVLGDALETAGYTLIEGIYASTYETLYA